MKIAIYGKQIPSTSVLSVNTLFHELRNNEIEFSVNSSFHQNIAKFDEIDIDYPVYDSLDAVTDSIDFLLSVGGDGTILDAIYYIGDSEVPVIGFNTGRLGFLANNAKESVKEMVAKMVNGEFSLEQRSLLQLETEDKLFDNYNFALNELTVHKKDSSSMMTIHTYINDEYLNSYWADGLIIATPTGSTAYSLSCGGPILIPQSKNFVINPIAPHNLSARPIIVSDDVEIRLDIEGRDEDFLATLDSRSRTISNASHLKIRKAPFSIKLVQFEGQNFFKTIRGKLLWGLDKRN